MSTEKMRTEFEAWVEANFGLSVRRNPAGAYQSFGVYAAWEAWQASRAAVVVELPSKWNDPTNSNMQSWDSGIDDARMAIEAAGLKVAP
ncbi:hypothetical protein [Pseudomonas typographi]|uniref:hypothetical protein n=1 Tax=Pseudomonas typographi TaxID=2715964 RepID=UPI001684E044|nr:hypothetical protein [Pseudomonas typographi]MBD1589759.1 hypothetical protein [Pseudomonas typographi]